MPDETLTSSFETFRPGELLIIIFLPPPSGAISGQVLIADAGSITVASNARTGMPAGSVERVPRDTSRA